MKLTHDNHHLWAWLWLFLACQAFSDEVEPSFPSTLIPETPNVLPGTDHVISEDEINNPVSSVAANMLHSRSPKLEITNTGNTTKIIIKCSPVSSLPSSLDAVHDSDISETTGSTPSSSTYSSTASNGQDSDYSENLSSPVKSSPLSDKVDLVALDFDGSHEVSVESQDCDHITIDGGVPDWVERLSIKNDEGSITLPSGWAKEARHLRNLWLRISKGLTIKKNELDDESHQAEESDTTDSILNLCSVLPPSLELLDASHTFLETLKLDGICSSKLTRLEASHSSLHTIALCTPSLVTLHLSANSLNGSLKWMTKPCGGGLAAVEYLQANHNFLTEVDTCGWFSLRTLDLRHNAISSLDITTCHSSNLTSVTAPHNRLVVPPVIPDSLLHLDLNHNELESIPMITSTLMTADFSHNNIIEIGKARFKRARKLLHLSLAYNNITRLKEHDLSGLRELRTLDLSHNQLREIAGTSLMHLRHLKKLYLHHNHLNSLDSRDLAALIPRVHATLHHNPWHCVCQLLASLQRLQHCPDCQPRAVAVECRERGSKIPAGPFLQTCLHAVQEVTQRLNKESDEDLSEEQNDDGPGGADANQSAVVAVPVLLILIAVGAVVAASYRFYHSHKRTISTRWNVFRNRFRLCRMCGCSPMSMNNGDLNSHQHGGLSQIEHDSDTETEL